MASVLVWRKPAVSFPLLWPALAVTAACGLFDSDSASTVDAGDTLDDAGDTAGGDGEPGAPGDASGPRPDATPVSELPARVRDTIRSDDYARLVLEVDIVEDMEPRDGVESAMEDLFEDILDKPDGVDAIRDDVLAPRGSDHEWSFSELQDLAADTFDLEVDDSTTVLHTMWLDGRSDRDSEDGVILGLQFGRHIVLFKETIDDVCTSAAFPLPPGPTCRAAERGIWTHEIGHAIGLVDNGLPMVEDHKDPERGAHSKNDDCIMYWAYTTGGLGGRARDFITGDEPELGFDEYCLSDIAAVRDAP